MSGKRERRDGDAPVGELSGAMGGVYCDATTGGVTTSGGGLLPCASGGWTTGAVRATVAAAAAACEDRSAARSASSCDSTFSRRRSAEVCAVASLPGGRLLGPASSGMVMCRGVPAGWVISRNTGGGVRGDGGGSTWRGVAGGGDCGGREAKRPFSRNWFRVRRCKDKTTDLFANPDAGKCGVVRGSGEAAWPTQGLSLEGKEKEERGRARRRKSEAGRVANQDGSADAATGPDFG
ncbi:hypothetical protein K438DRAFT_1776193 [Mycena galopus ATCC 62051]|nr:hypothetical protein K438DRAFT_1776193 [Mycena galopus ATCC 62051]